MKKIIMFWLIFVHLTFVVSAQNVTFVYVSHDETVPTERLVSKLKDVFNSADEENPCIMYLAIGENPKVIMSLKSTAEEIEEFFNEFFYYDFHIVSPSYDLHRILEIVGSMELLGKSFTNTTFKYYLSKAFISCGYFEDIVAKGIYCMELHTFAKERVRLMVYTPSEEGDAIKTMFNDAKGLLSGINIRYMKY